MTNDEVVDGTFTTSCSSTVGQASGCGHEQCVNKESKEAKEQRKGIKSQAPPMQRINPVWPWP